MKQKQPVIDFWRLKHRIDDEVARLGWSNNRCRAFIINRYGKINRLVMTDDELIDLLETLQRLSSREQDEAVRLKRLQARRRKRK